MNIILKKIKIMIQKIGSSLSAMIMPIIGIIIAWGLLTAFFIPKGWTPVKVISDYIVGNTINFLIPILIGFLGGKKIYGDRGGFIGAAATLGIIVGARMFEKGTFYGIKDAKLGSQFLGAMICGPLSAFMLKKGESLWQGKIKPGFEMLVDNFALGIISFVMILFSFFVMPFVIFGITYFLELIVNPLTKWKALPVTSLLVEPAKPLFLNNAINHGVFTPLGLNEVQNNGKSLLFYIESNPGPGMGILLAYMLMNKKQRGSASSASVIHFFGGIHEVYFPFIIVKPILLLAVISGGAAGVAIMQAFDAGAIAPASPGSIIALFTVSYHSSLAYAGLACGIFGSLSVSFLVAILLFKFTKNKSLNLNQEITKIKISKNKYIKSNSFKQIKNIIFTCDAGMGSSAMGAGILRNIAKNKGLDIKISNVAIQDLNKHKPDLIVVQENLSFRAKQVNNTKQYKINNFLEKKQYENLISNILKNNRFNHNENIKESKNILEKIKLKNIILNGKSNDMEAAIKEVGQNLLVNKYIKKPYIESMIKRNEDISVYIGNGVAIPHGQDNQNHNILKSGISIITYPKGIDWKNKKVFLVIGIASKRKEQINILSNLAIKLSNKKIVKKIYKSKLKEEILKVLN